MEDDNDASKQGSRSPRKMGHTILFHRLDGEAEEKEKARF